MTESGILAQLTEVKDIKTYIKVRMAQLDKEKGRIVEEEIPEKRQGSLDKIKGRQRELRKLKDVVYNEGVKEYSQNHWGIIEDEQNKRMNEEGEPLK